MRCRAWCRFNGGSWSSVVVLVVALTTASAGFAQEWARGMFEVTSHDFGSVARGAKAEYEFVLTNNFAADIHISGVQSSCGCTTPRISKSLLKPYEKGTIVARLNSGSYLGQRHATITVTFDQPSFAQVQLQVAGYVHEDVLFDPGGVEFGSVEQGGGAQGKVIVYRANRSDWQVLGASCASPYLACGVKEIARQNSQVWYQLDVQLAKTTPCGYLNDHVMLQTNDAQMGQIPVTVEGQVLSEINVSPTTLFLGTMRPGEKTMRQLVVWGRTAFRVLSVTGEAGCFELPPAVTDGPVKTAHIIPITFLAGAERGKVVKTIHVVTDLHGATADVSTYAIVAE